MHRFLVASKRGRLLMAGAALCLLAHALSAHAQSKIALGDGAVAKNPYDVAIGPNAFASGDGSSVNMAVAIGGGAQATAGAIAIGDNWRGGVKASGRDSIALGTSAMATQQSGIAMGAGSSATQANAVALGSGSVTAVAVATTGVSIDGATFRFAGITPTSTISVGNAGNERTITNVAAGRITATSTDAVNGSQLSASNAVINALGGQVSSLGNRVAVGLGGASSYNSVTGTLSTSLSYGGASYTSVQGVLDQLSNTVQNITNGGAPNKYFQVNATGAASVATGVDAMAAGPRADASGDQSLAQGGGATAAGKGSVAVGANTSASGVHSVALGAGSSDDGQSNVVSVGSSTQQRRITHVAAGTDSSDAVNVGQLNAVQAGGVQYDRQSDGSVDYGNITLGVDGAGAQIHHVANGTSAGDAVNLGQLNADIQTVQNWAKNYTDRQIQAINQNISTVGARANAGAAAAIAMAGLPQAYQPNQNAAAVAFGSFHGQAGMAIGVSTISESGRWVYKLNLASNTRGDAAASVGAAVTW
ncbi:YadA-like family protein [Dyella sp. GSA-30]|uniref:YadA family autotransporter adhesin n=1 Tax=Dyella sp. GSA-30 TaxID=2994496 RepID=UPI00249193D7|nr:YadA-like family protein [Dyella sp. GSA-30]BDU21767.1 hypothetical protein DYGSA30_32240 [Dyella sp. GSA-30]